MRAARYHANRDVRIDEIDEPSPEPDEVLIEVAACGICGSDLDEYLHGPRHGGDHLPLTLGHELGGTVVEAGEDADVEVGTEVVLNPLIACEDCRWCDEGKYNICNNLQVVGAHRQGGYAEAVTAPATNVVPLPDGLSPELAAVAEPMTVGYHAVRKSPLHPGDSVAVVGLGPIGLSIVQEAAAADADTIVASGHREARCELAEQCGADVVINSRNVDPIERIREHTDGGVDVCYEVAGTESSLEHAIESTSPDGHTELVGVFEGEVEVNPMPLVNREQTVAGSAAYQTGPLADRDFGPVLRNIEDGTYDPELLVTSRVDLEDIEELGFEELADSSSGEVKVLVRP